MFFFQSCFSIFLQYIANVTHRTFEIVHNYIDKWKNLMAFSFIYLVKKHNYKKHNYNELLVIIFLSYDNLVNLVLRRVLIKCFTIIKL